MSNDKLKLQAWEELVLKETKKIRMLIPTELDDLQECFVDGVDFAIDNIENHPKVAKLLEKCTQYTDLLTDARKLRDELKKLSGLRLKIVDEFDSKYSEGRDE